jgi:hypothetical protein
LLTASAVKDAISPIAQNYTVQTTYTPESGPTTPNTTTDRFTSTSSTPLGKITTDGDITTTTSCAGVGCFDANFKTCTAASETFSVLPLGTGSDTIIGPVPGGCSVKFQYLKNPNTIFENKSMTCTLDNSLDFKTADQQNQNTVLNGGGKCTGSFIDALKSIEAGNK